MKPSIHRFQTLDSTNKKAYELALKGALHGDVVQAENQTAGRGRLGKKWFSTTDKGLCFSIILRPTKLAVDDFPKITMVAGLATALALEKTCGITASLKWPNDIFIGERKCCGILTEAGLLSSPAEERFAIVGIGVNVLTDETDFIEEISKKSTSLLLEDGNNLNMDAILIEVRNQVLSHIERLEKEGFALLLKQWRKRDLLFGRWLKWVTLSGEVILAKSEGPDEDGKLKVRDKEGTLHEVLSGDISLAGKLEK